MNALTIKADNICKNMVVWPNASGYEFTIIEQFQTLRNQLTTESAIQLCERAPGAGFLAEMHRVHNLRYEGAFQSYLRFLRSIVPLVPRSKFLRMFIKSCPGCAALQFLCILCLHPSLEDEVTSLFRDLLFDRQGLIVDLDYIVQLAMLVQGGFKRLDVSFPHMGNCLDFDQKSEGFNKAFVLGQLLSSDQFCELMKSNAAAGAQIAHEMIKNLQDSQKQSQQLRELLSKYPIT